MTVKVEGPFAGATPVPVYSPTFAVVPGRSHDSRVAPRFPLLSGRRRRHPCPRTTREQQRPQLPQKFL